VPSFKFPNAYAATLAVATAFLSSESPATDAPPGVPAGTPVLSQILASSGLTLNGYVASSYYRSTGYNSFHQFDTHHDTFQLDQAGLQMSHLPSGGFGGSVDLLAGEDARILNVAEHGSHGPFNARQAFIQYAAGSFTFIAGKFVTLAGAESSNPTRNSSFSRSLLFFAEPLTHTGVRVTWAPNERLTFFAGVNNGWNVTSLSSGSKTAELGVSYSPTKQLSLSAQGYFGKVRAYDAARYFVDFVGTWSFTDALELSLSYDRGRQEQLNGSTLNWDGVAGYLTYAFSDQWHLSLRAEYLNDLGGFVTGTRQSLREGTATLTCSPVKSFDLRIEARYDTSGKATFVRTMGATGGIGALDDHQSEFALQAIYHF